MNVRKIFLFCFVFLIVGEAIVRFDMYFDIFNRNAEAIIHVKMAVSELRTRVENGNFKTTPDQFRVLVLGDSYIYGSLIDQEKKFSKQLQKNLESHNLNGKKAIVLDVSRPNNNTSDNFDFLKYYNDLFQPHVVFWAYHFNDIQDLRPMEETIDEQEIKAYDEAAKRKTTTLKSILKGIYKTSQLIRFLSSSLQRELKMQGIVIPTGDFYALTQNTYQTGNANWELTKRIFEETIRMCQTENIELIVYKLPIFNLLNNNKLFAKPDKALTDFFTEQEVRYLYGYDDFDDLENAEKYRVSKYDGHPNANAHMKMADRAKQEISKILTDR